MKPRAKVAVLVVTLVLLLTAALTLPIAQWLQLALDWIGAHPQIAWPVYILGYILATVLVIPGSLLTLAAGFLFGLPLGVALVSLGSVLGAGAAFLVGRFLARDWVADKIKQQPRFAALDAAVGRRGFLIVFLTRLSPIFPFNLINYAYGLTGVRFRDYFLATWIGMFPVTVLYVYLGSAAKNLAEIFSGDLETGTAGRIALFAGLAATFVLTVIVTRIATRSLVSHLEAEKIRAGD
jgi:uncharacterized membrane protein YdjX (TVP38/TMEM64 family)